MKEKLDYSQETLELRRYLTEICLKDIDILQKDLDNEKTLPSDKIRIRRLIRKLRTILEALSHSERSRE